MQPGRECPGLSVGALIWHNARGSAAIAVARCSRGWSPALLFRRIRLKRAELIHRWNTRPALRLPDRAREAVTALSGAEPIKVSDVLAKFKPDEHVERANAYFVREHEEDQLFRRPFHGVDEVQPRIAGLSYVLQQLNLFEGAKILDFGCGTGWLSRVLATMGLDLVGVDVSENALRLARQFIARDPLADTLKVEFRHFDSITLPLEDESVDRIVSFDAFHHVFDQERTLREMERVLRPGGIIVFHEPGPHHSLTPTAQSEMRDYDVIENDIDLRRIWGIAERLGFEHIWVSLPSIHSPLVGLDQLDRVVAGIPSHDDVERIVQNVHNFIYNLRIFSLHKPRIS